MSEIVWEFRPVTLVEEVPSEGAWRERTRTIAGVGLKSCRGYTRIWRTVWGPVR